MTHPSESSAPDAKPVSPDHYNKKEKRSCAKCGCILGLIAVVLILIGVAGFRTWYKSLLGPERIAQIHKLETEIVQLPPEWHKPATAPLKEVLEFQLRFTAQMDALRKEFGTQVSDGGTTPVLLTGLKSGDQISTTMTETVRSLVTKMTPLIEETSAVASLKGYSYNTDVPTSSSHWLNLREFSKYTFLVALAKARDGDCIGAIDTALVPLRFVRHHPSAPLIVHMLAVSETSKAAHNIDTIAAQCSDTLALRHGLDMMNELRDIGVPRDVHLWQYSDTVGALRRAAALGYPADLAPQTLADYNAQSMKLYDMQFDQWLVDNLPAEDPRAILSKHRIATRKKEGEENLTWALAVRDSAYTRIIVKGITGNDPSAMLLQGAQANIDEVTQRANVAATTYDLARLHLAQRLAQLEDASPAEASTTGTATSATPVAKPGPAEITRYINPMPLDPATSQPLKFSSEGGYFYGVGPDKKDTGGNPVYDATNGTFSAGDIRIIH